MLCRCHLSEGEDTWPKLTTASCCAPSLHFCHICRCGSSFWL